MLISSLVEWDLRSTTPAIVMLQVAICAKGGDTVSGQNLNLQHHICGHPLSQWRSNITFGFCFCSVVDRSALHYKPVPLWFASGGKGEGFCGCPLGSSSLNLTGDCVGKSSRNQMHP